jgi:branched-chain amino acid transport system ATP-binding protein
MSSDETSATIALIEEVLAEKTLVLVEHDVELAMEISDRITVLHQGRVLAEGPPEAISADDDVQEAYLGDTNE